MKKIKPGVEDLIKILFIIGFSILIICLLLLFLFQHIPIQVLFAFSMPGYILVLIAFILWFFNDKKEHIKNLEEREKLCQQIKEMNIESLSVIFKVMDLGED